MTHFINKVYTEKPDKSQACRGDVYPDKGTMMIVASNEYNIGNGHSFTAEPLEQYVINLVGHAADSNARKEAYLKKVEADLLDGGPVKRAERRANEAEEKLEKVSEALDALVSIVHGEHAYIN